MPHVTTIDLCVSAALARVGVLAEQLDLGNSLMGERRHFSEMIRLLVSRDLNDALHVAAAKEATTISGYCRSAILEKVRRDQRRERTEAA